MKFDLQKRKVHIIAISLFVGAILGVFGNIFSLVLPESVVKDFSNVSNFDLGGLVNNETGVIIIDLK